MSIAAQNVAPNFGLRRSLTATDLMNLDDPCVIFEHEGVDDDGAAFWVYTIGGYLYGEPLAHGCTTKGDVIVIAGMSCREDADAVASLGLQDTIEMLHSEHKAYEEAKGALDRLASVSAIDRMDLAIKPGADKSDAFVRDVAAIRPLIGDDIVLASGSGAPS